MIPFPGLGGLGNQEVETPLEKLTKIMNDLEAYVTKDAEEEKNEANKVFRTGNVEKARKLYDAIIQKLLSFYTKSDETLMSFKEKLEDESILEKHKDVFNKASDIFIPVSSNLCLVLFKLKEYKKGEEIASQGIAMVNHYEKLKINKKEMLLKLHYRRCNCYFFLDECVKAMDDIDKCIELKLDQSKDFLKVKEKIKKRMEKLEKKDQKKYKNLFSKMREMEEKEEITVLKQMNIQRLNENLRIMILSFLWIDYKKNSIKMKDFFGYFQKGKAKIIFNSVILSNEKKDLKEIPLPSLQNIDFVNIDFVQEDYVKVYKAMKNMIKIENAKINSGKELQLLSNNNSATLTNFSMKEVKNVDDNFIKSINNFKLLKTLYIDGDMVINVQNEKIVLERLKYLIISGKVEKKNKNFNNSNILSALDIEKSNSLKSLKIISGELSFDLIEKILCLKNLVKIIIGDSKITQFWFKLLTTSARTVVLRDCELVEENKGLEWFKKIVPPDGFSVEFPRNLLQLCMPFVKENSKVSTLLFRNVEINPKHFMFFVGIPSLKNLIFSGDCLCTSDHVGILQQLAIETVNSERTLNVDFTDAKLNPPSLRKFYKENTQTLFSSSEVNVIF